MKRRSWLTMLMVFCLMTTLTGYAFAAQFTDTKGHWAESQIIKWADSGLASGYANGTFKPNAQVTRAEFVALVNRAFNINKTATSAADFKDVNKGNWFYADVMAAKAAGYTGGYSDGTFKPNQTITRQEAASILTRLLSLSTGSANLNQFTDAKSIQNWAQASVSAVVSAGLMGGYTDSTFKPLKSITRAEAVVSLDRAMNYKPGTVVTTNSAIAGKVSFMGSSLANATVKVFTADGYSVLQTATTDKNGSYKLNLAPGKYDLTATTSDRVAYQSDVTVNANQVATVNMTMDSAAVLNGTLKDKNGNLLKNCTIYFTTNPTFVTTTDSSGKFTLPVLANHVYSVRTLDPSKTDEAPVVINSALTVGNSGNHKTGTLNTPFAIKSSGGGGGGGGGSSTNNHVYNAAGTYGPTSGSQTITGDVTINVAGVTLRNTTITGNLTLAAGIGDGDVTLTNVTVQGSTTINGGGSNSVHLNNCTLASVIIDKEGVHVVAEGSTTVTTIDLRTGASLDSNNTTLHFLGITIHVSNGTVTLGGNLGHVTVAASGVQLTVTNGSVLENLLISSSATGGNIDLGNSTVKVLTNNAGSGTSVSGGTIEVRTPQYPVVATLPALLDAIQDAFNNLTPEQWASLTQHRDQLLSISDDKIISSLQSYGLAEPFENVINTNVTTEQAKSTLAIIRSLSDLGQGDISSNLALISNKVTELKSIYSTEISKLNAKGVTQQQVFDYGLDLYSGILDGTYTIHQDTYEEDLYDAAFSVLKNGEHQALYNVASLIFDRAKAYYTSKPDSTIGDLVKNLTFDDIDGSYIIIIEGYAESKAETNSQVQDLLDFAIFIKDFSQNFIPVS